MMPTFPVTITVPRTFFKDHLNRGCGETAKVVRETQTTFLVELDQEAWTDLYSDAEYYESFIGTDDYAGNEPIVGSAVRTLARLKLLEGAI